MTDLTGILGNQKNISHFDRASRQGKLSHAYIICGQKGSGKRLFAEYIAESLLCHNMKDRPEGVPFAPCGTCPGCIKTRTGNHPDLIFVTHKKENLISVNEVREQIVDSMPVKPYYGPYKIYIIEDADLMNVNAQNALLKTIEEPPSYGLLFLLTSNVDGLLETVRSRCLKIDMDLLSDEEIVRRLVKEHAADPQKAKAAAAYARGNLGRAAEIADGEDLAALLESVTGVIKNIGRMSAVQINAAAKEMEEADTNAVLDILRTWFRDVLIVKAANSQENLYFAEEFITIKDQAGRLRFEELNEIFRFIDEAEEEMTFNVKAEAAVETLLLKIRKYMERRS